jgi:hypothetical protein
MAREKSAANAMARFILARPLVVSGANRISAGAGVNDYLALGELR